MRIGMLRAFLAGLMVVAVSAAGGEGAEPEAAKSGGDAKSDRELALQGEYSGELKMDDRSGKVGVQVIALGEGKFHAVGTVGGLPGDGWDGGEKREADGDLQGDEVRFEAGDSTAIVKDGVITVTDAAGGKLGELKKVERKSETLGAKPPAGGVVLFDGTNADAFPGAKVSEDKSGTDKLLIPAATSKQKFQGCTLHVEFRTPFEPKARGQGRGNSGVYLQGRYEVQVLDSFGLEGKDNECGGIYSVSAPRVNMCYPPLAWQTYDIDYTPAEFAEGKKVKNARMTVRHNGVVVQENVEIPRATTAAPVGEGEAPGPLYLQDHGNAVRYRNIWLVEKK